MARILIVDEEPDMRLAMRNVLMLRGYEISEAGDGPSALAMASESRPDLVLLDMRLPGMDGAEALAGLKEIDNTIPVLMLTGFGHAQSAADMLKLGAGECLQKPFENAQLAAAVERVLAGPRERAGGEKPSGSPEKDRVIAAACRFRPLYFLAASLAFVLAGIAVYRQAAVSPAGYYREYPGAAANISSLVWAGENLFAGDRVARAVYRYSADRDGLRLEETYQLEKTEIGALAAAGDTLYVADLRMKTIEARKIAPGLPLVKSFTATGNVSALFFDGKYLWTCDSEGSAVLRRPDPELTPSVFFRLPEKPDQIFKDVNFLWTAVSATGKIYRHRLDDGLTPDGVFTLKTARPGYPLSAFAWRGGRLWLARGGLGAIVEAGSGELVKE